MAVTNKVGFAVGNKEYKEAKEICFYSIMLGLVIAIATAGGTLIFSEEIATIYTTEIKVIELAASLMFLAALFQFSEFNSGFLSCRCSAWLQRYNVDTHYQFLRVLDSRFINWIDSSVNRVACARRWDRLASGLALSLA